MSNGRYITKFQLLPLSDRRTNRQSLGESTSLLLSSDGGTASPSLDEWPTDICQTSEVYIFIIHVSSDLRTNKWPFSFKTIAYLIAYLMTYLEDNSYRKNRFYLDSNIDIIGGGRRLSSLHTFYLKGHLIVFSDFRFWVGSIA